MTTKEQVFETVKKAYGFVPNLIQEIAEHSPVTAEIYLTGAGYLKEGVLSPAEQQAAFIAISSLNGCKYCVAAHGTVAQKAAQSTGLSKEDIKAIAAGEESGNERIDGIVDAARLIFGKKGWLSEDDIKNLAAQGIGKTELYELIAITGLKTISNYVNHIGGTELDAQFAAGKEFVNEDGKQEGQCCSTKAASSCGC